MMQKMGQDWKLNNNGSLIMKMYRGERVENCGKINKKD